MVTQPLGEYARVSHPAGKPPITSQDEQQRTNRLALWGLGVMFIGAAVGVIGKKLIHDDVVLVVGVLISLAGMFLAVYPYLSPPRLEKYDPVPPGQPEVLTPSQPANYLPQVSNIEYIPSITERTTDLLKTSTATGPKQKEDGESQA